MTNYTCAYCGESNVGMYGHMDGDSFSCKEGKEYTRRTTTLTNIKLTEQDMIDIKEAIREAESAISILKRLLIK